MMLWHWIQKGSRSSCRPMPVSGSEVEVMEKASAKSIRCNV
jgi:hypothetical protein